MNIVTILGNTNSGAGAIYEYLIGRKDAHDPFNKKEFRILHDPGGINDLYKCYDSYSLQSFNESLQRLINLEKLYRSNRKFYKDGLGLGSVENYKLYWENYKIKITGEKYNHRYIFNDIKSNIFKQLAKRIFNRLGFRRILFKNYYTGVSRREFRDYTFEFLSNIVNSNNQLNKLNVLNQCGTFSSPLSSTELLGEPKIICVRRNPLDQYAELKLYKGVNNPNDFVNWYLHLKRMESREQFQDEKVLEIFFEDFIFKYEQNKKLICEFLNIDHQIQSSFQPEVSKKNIYKYKTLLNENEIQFIKEKLLDFINIST